MQMGIYIATEMTEKVKCFRTQIISVGTLFLYPHARLMSVSIPTHNVQFENNFIEDHKTCHYLWLSVVNFYLSSNDLKM